MSNPFASASMAEGYARSRPPLHERLLKLGLWQAGLRRVGTALDVGCGAGISTKPLAAVADRVAGIDPVHEMLGWARRTAPEAKFCCGRAEALPVRTGSVELITAAGSLNYSDPEAALREAARALRPGGAAIVYDFGQGRGSRNGPALAKWFAGFARRHPAPASEAVELSPEILQTLSTGLRLAGGTRMEMVAPMTRAKYVAYLMTETNVTAAVRGGAAEEGIREWLEESLGPVFGAGSLEVGFPAYVACLCRD